MNYAEHIQDIHLNFPEYDLDDQMLSKLAARTPRLQILMLFHGDIPTLPGRALELSCCPVLWSSFKLSVLMTLCLDHVPHRAKQDMEEFLATLSYVQDLEHLYLNRALASAPGLARRGRSRSIYPTYIAY